MENNLLAPWIPCCFPYDFALQLFDFWQEEHEPREDIIRSLTQYYGDVKLFDPQSALLLPVSLDDERIVTIPFWIGDPLMEEPNADVEHIESGSHRDWEYCLDFSKGKFSPALFLQSGDTVGPRQSAVLCVNAEKLQNFFGVFLQFLIGVDNVQYTLYGEAVI